MRRAHCRACGFRGASRWPAGPAGLAQQPLHHQVALMVLGASIEDGDDVGMAEAGNRRASCQNACAWARRSGSVPVRLTVLSATSRAAAVGRGPGRWCRGHPRPGSGSARSGRSAGPDDHRLRGRGPARLCHRPLRPAGPSRCGPGSGRDEAVHGGQSVLGESFCWRGRGWCLGSPWRRSKRLQSASRHIAHE